MNCISCLMICKIFLCCKFPHIEAKKKEKKAVVKRYAFQVNTIIDSDSRIRKARFNRQ